MTDRKIEEIVVKRVFDAPVTEVWKYWTDAAYVQKWWGPRMFSCPMATLDVRVGGVSVVAMQSPDGQVFYSSWTYITVIPLEKIEYIHNLADKDGKTLDPVSVGMPADFPQGVQSTITFTKVGEDKTEMIVTEYFPVSSMSANAKLGLEQSIEKMAEAFAK